MVGGRERGRGGEHERLGRNQVDDKIEFGWLQYRQIGRLLTLENPAGEDAYLAVRIRPSGAIANQTASRDGLAPFVDRRNRIVFCQGDDFITSVAKQSVGGDHEPAGLQLDQFQESRAEGVFTARV